MDDIRKLRNLLSECDHKINFKKYDENIKKFYSNDFSSSINKFDYDKEKIKLKNDVDKSDYDVYRDYLEELNILKDKCNYILKNNISIENLSIPSSFYKGDILLLDNINNVRTIIELLNTMDEKKYIYHNIEDNDFAILNKNIKLTINHKQIIIKRKYYKISEEEIISDVLKSYQSYYISKDSFSSFFALLEKKKSKKAVRNKRRSSILKNVCSSFLPALLLTIISIFVVSNIVIQFQPFDFFSGVRLAPILDIIIKFSIFGGIIWAEATLSRSLLNNFKVMNGVSGYWALLLSSLVNLFVYIGNNGNVIMSILVWLCAIFYGFWCGPNFRKKEEYNFSLLGRLLVTLTVMDFYFMVSNGSFAFGIVVVVLLLFVAILPIELKKIEKSPWYYRGK